MSEVPKNISDKARMSAEKGAQDARSSSVDSMRGLPRSERPRPKKNIRVLCLQEPVGREQKGKSGGGVKLFHNEKDTKRNGVDTAVAESLDDFVSAVNRTSSRIMAVRIDTKEGYWRIMLVYAAQAGCPVYEKDEFYLNLDEAIRSVREGDYLTIRGELNGHVCVHKGRGVGVRNEEERVSALKTAHDFAVCSTFFAKRKSQKIAKGRSSRIRAKGRLGETRGVVQGDKVAWFRNDEVQGVVKHKKSAYKHWQKTRTSEDLAAYRTFKRLAKAAVAKAKNTEMDALHEQIDIRKGKKFVFRLAKTRHRDTGDTGSVKSVRNSEGVILKKPGEVRRRSTEKITTVSYITYYTSGQIHMQIGATCIPRADHTIVGDCSFFSI
ncbi:unnamed protein product [Haemonchus placei]|uniref:Reverse transcriptase domain-containing protein n=1 Tax=Haemonchus placei TaxID=6290 RepID=A0A0N4WIJ1_HAEPC|nr:unnamed protein product [Haemonchus placei]